MSHILCNNLNVRSLRRIEKNNAEACRYYLVLKSGQFQPTKIVDECFLRLCLLYIYPVTDGLYTFIKRGIIVLLLVGGQSRASRQ